MTIKVLAFADPFFSVRYITNETDYEVGEKSILVNLSEKPMHIRDQTLQSLQSVVVTNVVVEDLDHAVIIERFADYPDEQQLFEKVRKVWPSAYDVRGEERLKGVAHYMSPKEDLGQIRLSMYHAGSVPLKVGLHKDHPFCEVPGFREVHTQIVGFGKMQQCRERDVSTLYMEELMAPGTTHRPMYDEFGNYPWHQFETITPGIFMAFEILPEKAV
ncbi:hypothetical protein [Cohaesibacter gelatinilyticus]|uniref:Uncharacterized protein n=1 Tax=Cohaesibacter gelatinilyticus TaxID=372072 RepID=A0A285PI49_9HYPH|nr:hypothetical protein [Cohaesibacter gelatinilyticus]SNZ21410.1 hypothetical protein SAMN06265368_4530 [Cohaesibacter gelatinilyticus]